MTRDYGLPYHLGKNAVTARNHAICSGHHVVAAVHGGGYPAGQGWSPATEAIAQFMVRACNSHHALVQALQAAMSVLEAAERDDQTGKGAVIAALAREALAKEAI